ncbi:hypothetical protein [Microbispora triticiradicis]|uniref:Uncharacterized protein n=2 Tax=Microbispora TaxID=2005 RepID=A0ABY3LPI7_9ACTN|nr:MULTISPECIES: hypothetical protein [Microbispora]TYB47095.1 hypothetical protein FXF59_30655 [Microbispora tritici]
MGTALTSAALMDHDLPEPTSYRGQHVIPLEVPSDAWLAYHGLSYWLDPIVDGQEGTCGISLISDDGLELTCAVYDEAGREVPLADNFADPRNPDARSLLIVLREGEPNPGTKADEPVWTERVRGNSLTFRFNYTGSREVPDVVLPLELGAPVVQLLDRRRLCFRLKSQPATSTLLAQRDRDRLPSASPLIYLHGYEDPDTGAETIGTRLPPIALTHERIAAAWQTAKTTGYFDPTVFPNVPGDQDQATRAGLIRTVADLDEATVVQQLSSGARLVIRRTETGSYTYRFLPAPSHCRPGLVLVEYYRLTSFPARYGPGRTIKTFSLLPGEKTTIRVSTYKRSTESLQKTASILDASNSDTESEFARTVNSEQSNQDNASRSFEYRVETEAEGQANWGWGSASAKVAGGVSGSSNSARQELSKNLTNAVSRNVARASSRREVQVDTSLDVKLEEGEEQAVERTLENINVSRTLNFVFRQMNQEFITLLHLVDVRVAFFNGHAESRDEVPLTELDRLLGDCLRPDRIAEVRDGIHREVRAIRDLDGRARPDFVQTVSGAEDDPAAALFVDPDCSSSHAGPNSVEYTVPGVLVAAGRHILRTDGIVVDAFLGEGNALDDYSIGLQTQAVRARQVENSAGEADSRLRRIEAERLELALKIVADNDSERAALYQQLFVRPQIVNQIDHAAVNSLPDNGPVSQPASAN